MKVCIHIHPASKSLGGCEVLAAHIAALLRVRHQVEIVHHRRELDTARLSEFAGIDLGGVTDRFIERRPTYFSSSAQNPLAMYREPLQWGRELAGGCEVFITLTHELPPFNPAPNGILVLLFPMSSPLQDWPLADVSGARRSVRNRLSRAFYRRRYAALWRGYGVKLAISEFTARWARRRWDIQCCVLHPLVDCSAVDAPKKDVVLALGRFSISGVSKHQHEMAAAFGAAPLDSWRLTCVGEARTEGEIEYARSVETAGRGVFVATNASHAEVRTYMAEARIFWHAAGLGEDEAQHPERLEHFGIATVEAMANGCVPVVIGRGGQAEIIEHGRSGFLCESLEEMVTRTCELAVDPHLWERMSSTARRRAQLFSGAAFTDRLHELAPFL